MREATVRGTRALVFVPPIRVCHHLRRNAVYIRVWRQNPENDLRCDLAWDRPKPRTIRAYNLRIRTSTLVYAKFMKDCVLCLSLIFNQSIIHILCNVLITYFLQLHTFEKENINFIYDYRLKYDYALTNIPYKKFYFIFKGRID